MKPLTFFSIPFLLALGGAPAVHASNTWQVAPQAAPLTAEQIFEMPDFARQPMETPIGIAVQSRIRIIDGWRYTAAYRYRPETGWRIDGFSFEFAPTDPSAAAGASQAATDTRSQDAYLVPVEKELPPSWGGIPEPSTPEDPTKPKISNGQQCPYAPGWDASWRLEWVPAHWQKDENGNPTVWVEGHWRLQRWTVQFRPSGLCK